MILHAYFPKIITTLLGGALVYLGIITFGNALAFDLIYVSTLIFTGLVCKKDINVVSIITVLIFQLIWESLAWNILVDENPAKVLFYLTAFYTVYCLRYDWLAKIAVTVVFIASLSELYWYFNDYSAPEIYWSILIMVSNILIRHLVFYRVSFVDRYYPSKGESINLDWIVYKLSAALTILQAIMIFEYLSRHLLGLDNILLVYNAYSYIIHCIGIITILAIFIENFKRLIPKRIKA
jgi:hypothetical protein